MATTGQAFFRGDIRDRRLGTSGRAYRSHQSALRDRLFAIMAKREKLFDAPVLGTLRHAVADGWKREISILFLGEEITVELLVDIDPNDGLETRQVRAFQQFEQRRDQMLRDGANAILGYYQSVCDYYRGRQGVTDPNDKRFPLIKTVEELRPLVKITGISVPYAERVETIGLLGECTWEEEHGVGVRFENGRVTHVGFQDAVL